VAVRLYRSDVADDPYFGRGSFWTPSVAFARKFSLWTQEPDVKRRRGQAATALYAVEAERDGTWLDLTNPHLLVPSSEVTRRVASLAACGYRWVLFYEGVYEGVISAQAVYLGDEPLRAVRLGV
jgi:hypothetical protein